ncbi:MAG: ABC transporter permease [Specibacter sp.]
MIGYSLRRLLQSILVVFVVTVIVFILLHQLPGGAARAILGPRATAAQIADFNVQNGYNQPLFIQYFRQLGQWATGNFGFSIKLNQSVSSLLVQRMPKTIILGVLSLALTVLVAVPLGIYQAVRRNKPFDYIATGLAFVFYAAPTFFIGLIMIEIFSQNLGWFPPEAPQSNGIGPIFAQFDAMVLPIVTLALLSIAGFSRYMRSSVLDNVDQDYVRTAQAKGATPSQVMYHHVLRNAMIPIITLLGLSIPAVFAGALITESIFNFPGMGLLFWQAAQASDYPVELGVVIITAFATVAGNLLADISLAVLDPRVKL